MADFNISIIPASGLELIASATATSPLIIDSVIGSTVSYTETQIQALCNTPSAFTMSKVGDVDSASVINNIARVVVGFAHNDDAEQELHTIIITAHTATVSEKVLCAVSDDTHTLHVFSKIANMIPQRSELAFNIAVNDNTQIEAPTFALSQYLTHTETERFVTTHKAGAQDEGDDQRIRGMKTFENDVYVNGWLITEAIQAYGNIAAPSIAIRDDVEATNIKLHQDGIVKSDSLAIGSYDEQTPLANISFTSGDASFGTINIKTGSTSTDGSSIALYRDASSDKITVMADELTLGAYIIKPASWINTFGTQDSKWSSIFTLVLDATDVRADNVIAKNVSGVLPAPKNIDGNITCPVGAIVVAHIKRSVGNKNIGDTFTVEGTGNDANAVYTENTGTNFIPKYGVGLPEGAVFRLLTGLNFNASTTILSVYALVMRIA